MNETKFWELINRLEEAARDVEMYYSWDFKDGAVERAEADLAAVRAELQAWLEATREPPWLDPTSRIPDEVVEATIRADKIVVKAPE